MQTHIGGHAHTHSHVSACTQMHSEQKIQMQKNDREVNQMLSTKAALGTAAKQEHLFIMLLSGAARAVWKQTNHDRLVLKKQRVE